jgi:hypothetical protein
MKQHKKCKLVIRYIRSEENKADISSRGTIGHRDAPQSGLATCGVK